MRICLSIAFVVAVLVVGVLIYSAGQAEAPPPAGRATGYVGLLAGEADELERRIYNTVRERGALTTAETLEIQSEIEGEATIVRVVPEGSVVKKGELLVELDRSPLEEELLKQQVVVAEAQADFQRATTATAALKDEAKDQLAAEELAIKVAELDRSRYMAEGGEFEFQLKSVERQIAVAEERLGAARKAMTRAEKGTAGDADVTLARLALIEAQAARDIAQASKQLLTGPTRDYRAAALDLAVVRAQADLSQTRNRMKAAIGEAEAEAHSCKAALRLEEARLARIQGQIEKCSIHAPRGGLVVFANVTDRRGGSEIIIEEGTVVRHGQTILRMPDMSRLRVRVQVHESRIPRIRNGQPATIRFDAFIERAFEGKVVEIGRTPLPSSWFAGNVQEYEVLVSVERPLPELRVGMTALVEVDVSGAKRE